MLNKGPESFSKDGIEWEAGEDRPFVFTSLLTQRKSTFPHYLHEKRSFYNL